jgi:hypothetical protein
MMKGMVIQSQNGNSGIASNVDFLPPTLKGRQKTRFGNCTSGTPGHLKEYSTAGHIIGGSEG